MFDGEGDDVAPPTNNTAPQGAAPKPKRSFGASLLDTMGRSAQSGKPLDAPKPLAPTASGGFSSTGNSHVEKGSLAVGDVVVKLEDDVLKIGGGQKAAEEQDGGVGPTGGGVKLVSVEESDKAAASELDKVIDRLLEIVQVGRDGEEFLCRSADGQKHEKIGLAGLRHAGPIEKTEFAAMKANGGRKRKREETAAGGAAGSASTSGVSYASGPPPPRMTLVKGLLVRVVSEAPHLKEHDGAKVSIESVSHKDRTARVVLKGTTTFLTVTAGDVVTVVPQTNKEGLVLAGQYTGQKVKVKARNRDAEGDITSVVVVLKSGEEATVGPDDICSLA